MGKLAPVKARPALRLVDCENLREEAMRSKNVAILKALLSMVQGGQVSRLIVVYDNGPETLANYAVPTATGQNASQLARREAAAMLHQAAAHVLDSLDDFA